MNFITQAGMALALLRQYGVRDFYYRFCEWCDFRIRDRRYQKCLSSYFPSQAKLQAQREETWGYEPLIRTHFNAETSQQCEKLAE